MAKKPKTAPNEGSAPTVAGHVEGADNLTLKYGDWEIDVQALGWPAGYPVSKQLAYLMLNGFKQSLTDASAATKEQKAKWLEEAQAANPGEEISAEAVNEAKAFEARTERFKAIIAGTVGAGGGGPKLPQIDRVMKDIAEEQIRAAVAAKGLAMPKGDALKALIEKRLSVAGDSIRAAAQARIDAAKNVAADLDDILSA